MKKILLSAGLAAAVISAAPQAAEAKLKVFACFPEWEALVSEIGGDKVDVFSAIGPLKNPDHVQVTPALLGALKDASLMVCTGADFEGEWLPSALERAQNPKLAEGQPGRFFARDFVEGLADDHTKEEEKTEGHLHEQGNPHVQGDPYRIRTIAGRLGQRLIQVDPANADFYKKSTTTFVRDLGATIKELEKKAAPLSGINIVTQAEHSAYLLSWLKVHNAAVVEPHVGVPPGPADMARIVNLIPTAGAKFVLHAAYEDPRSSKFVAEKADVPLIKVPFTLGGTEDGKTYKDFYTTSVQRMLDGLNGKNRP